MSAALRSAAGPGSTVLLFSMLLNACVDFGQDVASVPLPGDSGGGGHDSGHGGDGGATDSGGADSGGAGPQEVVVVMLANAFDPPEVTVHVGDTVTWVNEDPWFHIVASGTPEDVSHEWMSPTLDHGEAWSRTFDELGETLYFCWNHAAIMRDAQVIVEAR